VSTDPPLIGLMPGVPVPRLVSLCDGNGEVWFEVHAGHGRGLRYVLPDGSWTFEHWPLALPPPPDAPERYASRKYATRADALAAIRNYIGRTSAAERYVLAEETVDRVAEPA